MGAGTAWRGEIRLDRGAQQRVHEAQGKLASQEAGGVQLVRGGLRLLVAEAGERGGVSQLAGSQHGDRTGQSARVPAQASQTPHDPITQTLSRQRPQTLG